jgi:hypothetical protein
MNKYTKVSTISEHNPLPLPNTPIPYVTGRFDTGTPLEEKSEEKFE